MKEDILINTIKSVIGDKYIGDDCAYLKDLGIVVSQDSLVEGVHFSMDYMTPYQLGYKSAMVNISDISASGGRGRYMTVALSLPKNITSEFVKEFYEGLEKALLEVSDIEVVGGDITGSDKIMVSVAIIGTTEGRKISSRKNAKTGQAIVVSGEHGSSACGLRLLQDQEKITEDNKFCIYHHILPMAKVGFAEMISEKINEDYAMMDSSDGLADVLYKIAVASDKTLVIDFEKVPYDKNIKNCFSDYKEMILFGGEDYQIIATVPEKFAKENRLTIIGHVEDKTKGAPVKILNYDKDEKIINNLNNCFNHFMI